MGRGRRARLRARASARRRRRRCAASCRRWSGCGSGSRRRRRSATSSAEILSETGYTDALEAERTIEAQGRIENLEELVRVAREYDATAEDGGSAGEFLQQIALLADADSREDDEGLVTLMTMHNAKGLEYPIVFIIGIEDGVFPHSRALDEGGLEEERRLAYVGITRAMRDLTLTYARRRNSVRRATRSACARASSTRSRAS